MRVVIQRVSRAEVSVQGSTVGSIGTGLLVLVGIRQEDNEADADYLVEKIAGLRVFQDDAGKMNLSVQDVRGALLIVSQFTLYGDCRRGRRPSFDRAAAPDRAVSLYDYFVKTARSTNVPVQVGMFQAMMEVTLVNHGPVTILIDSEERSKK